ncbi:hypothetical protein G9272_24105 [Streptomyces asoensis]|uniref:Uncharacterized protein n=1 Tax=Streptomyces asoensis TaxID=249586 RepID=A0A6M4WR24_9ACTN|nr:hypothetical protein [Streptomyces asoensis]QJT02984.1 hypothetical protein G9272_24105 [Streptomyces asoensis]
MPQPESAEFTDEQLRIQQAALIAAAGRDLGAVSAAVLGDRLGSFDKRQTKQKQQYFLLKDAQGASLTIWLDAVPMESGALTNTMTNTTTDQYIVHVSDRLPVENLSRVLAHEVGELLATHDRSSEGLAPVREHFLTQGAEIGDRHELSSRDHGSIAELNWLAHQASAVEAPQEERAEARTQLSSLLDQLGMRPTAAMSETAAHEAESEAAETRRYIAQRALSSDARRLVDALAHPIENLSPADATALQASRDAALRAERQVEAFIGRREITMPMPGYDQNGLPLPRDQLEPAAERWAEYRAQVSERTVQTLEGQLAGGQLPLRKVVIGGGASLTGRDPEALLVDGAGRWHLDPGDGIVQSADQDRDLAQWMGVDPYSAVEDPRHRISIHAVRVWEDQLATQGDVVNGHARLRLGRDGELLAEVRTLGEDGKESATPLWVACDGTPSIATGLTPELVPGTPRGDFPVESRSEAVRLISDRLRELEGQGIAGAGEMRAWLTQAERSGADAGTVLGALNSSPALKDALTAGLGTADETRMGNCFTALDSTQKWEAARRAAEGRALLGDEVAESRFDPHAAKEWIVVGSGGTAVANAEIILIQNPDAHVTIIGSKPPPALKHQVQFPAMEQRYGHAEGGEKRLTFVEARVGAIETYQDEQGETRFQVPYVEKGTEERRVARSDGYVTSLGRTNPLPPALQVLADEVRDRGGEISGDLLFDKDDQYIGYGLTFAVDGREHRVDVDGAASWQLPREIFAPETRIQAELNAMGVRGLPSETGNAAPGFSPIARQSALRARAVAAAAAGDPEAVRRMSTIPERWQRPDLGQGATPPTTGPQPPALPQEKSEPTTERNPSPERDPKPVTTPGPAPAPAQPTTQAPAPAPAQSSTPAPSPTPSPAPGVSGSHLWQMGVPRGGANRPPAPAQQPPQQQPPGLERPEPGVGMGD